MSDVDRSAMYQPPRDQPRLLVIEDDPDTAMLVTDQLEEHFGKGCVQHVDNLADARAVDVHDIDLVVSDINLPDGDGTELLEHYLARRSDLPIVFVTGEGILDNAIEAIRNGAYDYVVKAGDYLFAVPLVVQKNLEIWKTKRENERLQRQLEDTLEEIKVKNEQLQEAVEQLEHMAATDPLTGLANRRAISQAIERNYQSAERYQHDLACIMIDLDGFKQLNDTLGHQAGDELLQLCGTVLEANCRRSDVAGRFGGDEFVLLLPQTGIPLAGDVAQRIQQQFHVAVERKFGKESEATVSVGMSLGVASVDHAHPNSPEQLIAFADHALYRAKADGKGCIAVYEPAHEKGSDLKSEADAA